MKEIKLKKLLLENFKCFNNLEINLDGNDLVVKGANGTGKSTIIDALNWLLFKKNAQDVTDFSIKPLDENGNSIPSIEVSVYGELIINGVVKSLKRTMKEVWTRKRGSKETTFTGHTFEYEIDGVPAASEKQFKAVVDEICDEKLFRLITNPYYFNNLDKKEKRKILMNTIDDDLEDIEIVRQVEKIKDLEEYLANKNEVGEIIGYKQVDDLIAISKQQTKKLTENLKSYESRIDELKKLANSNDNEISIEDEQKIIHDLEKELEEINDSLKIDSDIAAKATISNEILKIKSALISAENNNPNLKLKNENIEKLNNEILEVKKAIGNKKLEHYELKSRAEKHQRTLTELQKNNEDLNVKIVDLRKLCSEIKHREFDNNSTMCPTCGQTYPENKIAEIKANFNRNKSNELEKSIELGKETAKSIEHNKNLIELESNTLAELGDKILELVKDLEDLEEKGKALENELLIKKNESISKSNEILSLENELSAKEEELQRASTENAENSQFKDSLKTKKEQIEFNIDNHKSKIFAIQKNAELQTRIEELLTSQKRDSELRVQNETILALCDIFVSEKCLIIEDKINKLFKNVKFKLFEKQINGGVAEVCYATVNGIPYDDVNSAGKINAGLDIIQTLQKENDVKSFIFVDNAESITDIIPMENQMITFYVSKDYKTITF